MLEIDDLDVRNGQSLAEALATNPGKACRTVGGNQLQTARLIIRIYSSSALHCLSNSRSRGAGRVPTTDTPSSTMDTMASRPKPYCRQPQEV